MVGTLGSVGNNLLKGIDFQWLIVDEAGQATEPASLGAFRHQCPSTESKERYPRVIFVGDHMQLPPVVSEDTIEHTPEIPSILKKAGLKPDDTLKTSLFERLFRLWEDKYDNVIILSEQYRMNEAISRIIKNAFYPKVNYVPANDQIGSRTLDKYLDSNEIKAKKKYTSLITKIFDPTKPVVFINTEKDSEATEGVQDTEIQTESRFNIRESKIISKVVTEFLSSFSAEDQVIIANQLGIISPYRHQNNLIYGELRENGLADEVIANLRVDTVDRFQGDERQIIVISLTNSNDSNVIGQLHRDWRRMNVSISRAKAKLVLVGNRRTFTEPSSESKESDAKMRFKEVFRTIKELISENLASEINSKNIKVDNLES